MDFERYFLEQLHNHPSMQPKDVVKLCYQAAFGAEHLLQDKERARVYLQQEFETTTAREMPLYEQIAANTCRVHLAAWKYYGLPAAWLFRLFAASCGKREKGEERFWTYIRQVESTLMQERTAFSEEDWRGYLTEYKKKELSPVHHSEMYREQEHPAYRVADMQWMRLLPILQKTAKILAEKEVAVIAIDGRAASGKTTMAKQLQEIFAADVVQMDDFFLPVELRTAERFAQPGGNIHYERFGEEVLPFLSQAAGFSYRIFDCGSMDYRGRREIGAGRIRIVEGSYSQHPCFGDYADITVFSDVSGKEQMVRICRRNGEKMAEMFRERWIPLEEAYFQAYGVREKAEIYMVSETE